MEKKRKKKKNRHVLREIVRLTCIAVFFSSSVLPFPPLPFFSPSHIFFSTKKEEAKTIKVNRRCFGDDEPMNRMIYYLVHLTQNKIVGSVGK